MTVMRSFGMGDRPEKEQLLSKDMVLVMYSYIHEKSIKNAVS